MFCMNAFLTSWVTFQSFLPIKTQWVGGGGEHITQKKDMRKLTT